MSGVDGPLEAPPAPLDGTLEQVAARRPPFDVISETLELLHRYGKHDWRVEWDGAKRRAGATLREVMLHEVGHALAGQKSGHDEKWARTVRLLGGSPSVTLPAHLPKPEARWRGECPKCGATRTLHSAPRRVVSCGKCSKTFDGDLVFTWYLHGEPTTPPGAYLKELRLLRRRGKVA